MDTAAFIATWGYIGIIAFLVLTGCGLPIPEEVPIVAAGWLSAPHVAKLNPWIALGSCFIGAIFGDIVMYGIGRKFGRKLLQRRAFFASYLSAEKERHIEEMFHKHGLKVLFVSRFLVGIRSPIYITAGILKVPFRRFVIADMFCAGVMISTFFSLAYFFSDSVLKYITDAEKAVTITVVLAGIGVLIGYRYYRKRHAAAHSKLVPSVNCEPEPNDEKVEKSVA
ncbi:MAG: DedA family protein [Planctomycetia bacterium]|nr:DedA family protein [Planctomycetia bacterium]